MPSISVIVPTYNCARFLPASLDSILAQSLRATEIIVVDDGSTDDTLERLAPHGASIVVVRAAHGGYASARNLGLARARGDWVAFHDADDVALDDRLAVQLEAVHRQPGLDGVFCNGARMDGDGSVVARGLARRCAGRLLGVEDVFRGFPIYFQAALVRRAAFARTGAFDVSLSIHADMDYGYRLLATHRLAFVDRVVFSYRSHDTNVTRDTLQGREEIVLVLERLLRRDPESVRRIGCRALETRLARHFYGIARRRLRRGEASEARAAIERALALRPLDLRYRLLRFRQAF